MSGFVVCASCGTQIKAGRAYCLRCGEDLPVEGAPDKFSAWESLELPRHKLLIFLGVVALIVVMLLVVIWQTQPVPEYEVVQPLNLPGALRPVVPAPAAESSAPAESPRPAPRAPSDMPKTALDATRSGVAAYKTGNYDAARAAFEQSVALSPDDAEALNNLGQTLVRLNRVSEAVSRFERAVVLSPNNAPFYFNLAHAMGLLGKWDRAVAEYRAAVRLVPDDSATRYSFGWALHKKGDDEAAIPEFQRAIELAPGEASFHLSLGTSLEQVGRVPEAAREYEIFLEMAPTAPEAEKLRAHLETLGSARKRSPAA